MARAKGSGTLVKRGKFFMAKWIVDGKIYTRSTKCKEKRAALEKLEEFVHPYRVKSDIETLQNLQSQINVLENERNRTPLENAIRIKFVVDEYKKDINVSGLVARTEERYTSQMNVFEKFLGEEKKYMYQVTEKDAESFMQFIKAKNSVSTYNTYLKVLKRMFKICMKHDSNIRTNPFNELKLLKDAKATYRRELTQKEIETLIEKAAEKRNPDWKLFFMLGAYTGMRKEDCQYLKKSSVNLDTGKITILPIKTIKTGITAIIPIANELYEPLKEAMTTEGEFLLPKLSGYSSYYIEEGIGDVFRAAKIPTSIRDENGKRHNLTGFHAFRHTMTKKLYRQKIPITIIMKILGHKTLDMSLHYGAEDDVNVSGFVMSSGTNSLNISSKMYERLLSYRNSSKETVSEVLDRIIYEYEQLRQQSFRNAIEESKQKESDELDKMIDEVFGEDK